jgi:hypothetical protein
MKIGSVVIAIVAPALLLAVPARAQSHADAGVQHQPAAAPEPAPTEPPDTRPPGERAAGLKSIPNPGQLSESVRARLQEQAAGKHPSTLAQEPPRPLHELPSTAPAGTSALGAPSFRRVESEPLRRGEARMRRVQAVETVEGVTILSNRMVELPERRLTSLSMRKPAPPEAFDDEPIAASDSRVTETHSLRTLASRTVTPKSHGTGLGWLLWPFALFVTTSAVVGTLWFRKKVQ